MKDAQAIVFWSGFFLLSITIIVVMASIAIKSDEQNPRCAILGHRFKIGLGDKILRLDYCSRCGKEARASE